MGKGSPSAPWSTWAAAAAEPEPPDTSGAPEQDVGVVQSEDESEPDGELCPLGQLMHDVRSLRSYCPAGQSVQLDRDDVSCLPAAQEMQLVEEWLEEDWY